MGYSEVYCRICGVSFNISRIRCLGEPEDAGWRTTGDGDDEFCTGTSPCGGPPHCQLALRRRDRVRKIISCDTQEVDLDSDYEYESSSDDEPLEYDSDAEESLDGNSSLIVDDSAQDYYKAWLAGFEDLGSIPRKSEVNIFTVPQSKTAEQELLKDYDEDELEHLAGPHCQNRRGYIGCNISADEMKACRTWQCAIHKSQLVEGFVPLSCDQDSERESDYVLSGLSGHMGSRDTREFASFSPLRHGVAYIMADDFLYDDENETAVPFHPACFEIFSRASRLRSGKVDISGLVGVRNIDSEQNADRKHPALRRAYDQWWSHNPGDEFLAANPVVVPLLPSLIQAAVEDDPGYDSNKGAFELQSHPSIGSRRSQRLRRPFDPFLVLPEELKLEVLGYLEPRDMAGLRLTSRSFRQLPIYLWRKLLRREMPWLWEIYDETPLSIWATLTANEAKKYHFGDQKTQGQLDHEQVLREYRDIIKEELPELLDDWRKAEPQYVETLERWPPTPPEPMHVPKDRLNWYKLYASIKGNWGNLKGLQNRRKIWDDVHDILNRAAELREKGEIE